MDILKRHVVWTIHFINSIQTLNIVVFHRAGVQPTLDPCAEAFCDRPIALTQEGRSLVDDVCECVHDYMVRKD